MTEFEKEQVKLENIISIIDKVYEKEKRDLDNLYSDFVGSREDLWRVADYKKIHINNLEYALDKPYFARIDFTNDEDGKSSSIYIGKNGIMKDNNIVVTDWRAPISSLYYDAEVGKCSYQAPQGTVTGDLSLKRQYEIEKGKLINYFDVDLVSNDSLLQQYLNSNNDSRLKSIVATIQKEQNDVIRKPISDNIIVQGVAGSGKTTVALHRIAYLVYNYINNIKQDQYLVIGPNPVFLKYIKSVLPELDVTGVQQFTFEDFARSYLGEDIDINSSEKKVASSINGKIINDIDKFKCSIKYKDMIDKFLNVFIKNILSKDLMYKDFTILDKKVIQDNFALSSDFSNLEVRINLTIERLCKLIEEKNADILSNYINYSSRKYGLATTGEEKDMISKETSKFRQEMNRNCSTIIRKYFSKARFGVTKLYKLFISSIDDFNSYNYLELEKLKKSTMKNLKSSKYDFEDLAALMYIKNVFFQDRKYDNIKHVVIDEAQDLGEFNFIILKKCLSGASFSVFGDLAQSIYDYRSINNWESVNDVMLDNSGKIVKFGKSYRTTSEIMSVADILSDSIGLGKSDIVVRHGMPVEILGVDERDNIPDIVLQKVKEFKEKGYKTIAVISKTNLLSNYINDDLAERGLFVPNVSINDDVSEDKFNVCTICTQLSKGLEFDAVIINDASESIFSSKNDLDMKLLYVAITRALHEVEIIYSGELTNHLKKAIDDKKIDESIKKLVKKI